ncbi:hypothetical protein [Enterococcus faecium]|jgi:hypothetical protein|uniref:hypothetical protein n=1 Tax=Enterococcus faecium TaxID=1352 RepID=UPI001C48A4EA|nr:hypothetical protein [Enterococcus faecium]QXJ54591.1 hypothetical protein J9541_03500 [Enterococcus faecium]
MALSKSVKISMGIVCALLFAGGMGLYLNSQKDKPIESEAVSKNSKGIIEDYVDKSVMSNIDEIKKSKEWNSEKEFLNSKEVKEIKKKDKSLSEIKSDDKEVPLKSLAGEYTGNDVVKQMTITVSENQVGIDDDLMNKNLINVKISGVNGNEYILYNEYIVEHALENTDIYDDVEIKKEDNSDKFIVTFDNNKGLKLLLKNDTSLGIVAYLKVRDGKVVIEHEEESTFVGNHGTSVLTKKEKEEATEITSLLDIFGDNKLELEQGDIAIEKNEKAKLGFHFVSLEDNLSSEPRMYQYSDIFGYRIDTKENYAVILIKFGDELGILKIFKGLNDKYVLKIIEDGSKENFIYSAYGTVSKDKEDMYYYEKGTNMNTVTSNKVEKTEEKMESSNKNGDKNNVLEITTDDEKENISEDLWDYLDFIKSKNREVDVINYLKDDGYEDSVRDYYDNDFGNDPEINMIAKGSGAYDVLARETDSLLYFEPSVDLPYFDLYLKNGNTVKARNTTIDEIGSNLKIDKNNYDKLWVYNYETESSGTTNYFLITQKDEEILITLHTFKQSITEENRLAESLISLKPVDMKNATDKKDFKEVIGNFGNNPRLSFLLKDNVLVDKDNSKTYVIGDSYIKSSNDNTVIFALEGYPEVETQFRYAQMLMLAMFDRYFLDYYYDFRESM